MTRVKLEVDPDYVIVGIRDKSGKDICLTKTVKFSVAGTRARDVKRLEKLLVDPASLNNCARFLG